MWNMKTVEPSGNLRAALIEESLQCLQLGWLSLLPLFGLFFALAAVVRYTRAFVFVEDDWNPAQLQLLSGALLALISLLLHALVITAAIWASLQS